jgi:hypothetical protein
MIVVFGGVQVDKDGAEPRFPSNAVEDVGDRLRILLGNLKPRKVVGAAASGADLLAIEAARQESVPVDVVLPFDRATFRGTSVEDRGEEWTARFDRLAGDHPEWFVEGDHDPTDETIYVKHNAAILDHAEGQLQPEERLWVVVVRPPAATGSVSDDLADRARERGHLVLSMTPVPKERRQVFVAMPYGKKFDPVSRRTIDCDGAFRKVYVPALLAMDATIKRADLETDSGVIHVGMIEDLANSDLVICDLAAANPNVAYEMGLRHALVPKSTLLVFPVLSTSKKGQNPPFDVLPIRQARFERSPLITEGEAESAVRKLVEFLSTAFDKETPPEVDSPVHAWFELSDGGRLARREAAASAAEVEQDARKSVQTALLSSDPDRMLSVASALDDASLTSAALHGLRIQLGAGLISEGRYSDARVVLDMVEVGSGSPLWVVWAQQMALAIRRLGGQAEDPEPFYTQAEDLLREVLEVGGDSSETCGITAGLAKRRAMHRLEAGDRVGAAGHVARMVSLYRRGWDAEPDAYMGVNLIAGLRLQAQHFSGSSQLIEEAHNLAPVVLFFAEREKSHAPEDFYPASSAAEVRLNEALIATDAERERLSQSAAMAFAEAAALPAAPDNIRASGDQFHFLRLCGDDEEVLDLMASFFRGS